MQYIPKVSVVMSAYNETAFQLKQSIESILNQSFKSFEFIIVNDNPSNDELKSILCKYKAEDDRIIIIENEKNLGLPKSLNKAINKSKASYIMRMDADDISVENRMEYQYGFMENHPSIAMVAGDKENIDEDSKIIPGGRIVHTDDKHIQKMLRYGNPIVHPSVMLKKNVFHILGGYRDIKGGEDYDLWLRMLTGGYKIRVLYEQPVLLYRIRNNSITRTDFFWAYFSGQYARKLYKERVKYGHDSYSVENMKTYIASLRANKRKCNTVNAIYKEIENGTKKGKSLKIFCEIVKNPLVYDVIGNFILYKMSSL